MGKAYIYYKDCDNKISNKKECDFIEIHHKETFCGRFFTWFLRMKYENCTKEYYSKDSTCFIYDNTLINKYLNKNIK